MAKAKEEKPQIADKEESPEVRESLLLKSTFLKAEKEFIQNYMQVQRKML